MEERKKNITILVVDDEPEYQNLFRLLLEGEGYQVLTCSSGDDAMQIVKTQNISLVMTDLKMPGMDGVELVKKIKEIDDAISILIVTAYGSISSAVEAMKVGASGYFLKGGDSTESLLTDINRIATISLLKKDNEILRQKAEKAKFYLESKNTRFKETLELCKRVADSNINVLLLGESGVGKEVIANYIHENGSRSEGHLIPVNCQCFTSSLIESELFGHEKGAFTGAVTRRIGRFEEADRGTLFLDEIGDLPLDTQSKLLRALESRSIERIGSNKPIDLDIRLICATNKNLREMVDDGRFREDLMYRINAMTIEIPPLRERKEDIPGLIDFFFEKISNDQKKVIAGMDDDVRECLYNYDYPGNIRELRNIVERLVTLCNNGRITAKDLGVSCGCAAPGAKTWQTVDYRKAKAVFEKEYFQRIISVCGGNVSKAAVEAGISRRQLWNKINEYNLDLSK